jgi:hypothetical protein
MRPTIHTPNTHIRSEICEESDADAGGTGRPTAKLSTTAELASRLASD